MYHRLAKKAVLCPLERIENRIVPTDEPGLTFYCLQARTKTVSSCSANFIAIFKFFELCDLT